MHDKQITVVQKCGPVSVGMRKANIYLLLVVFLFQIIIYIVCSNNINFQVFLNIKARLNVLFGSSHLLHMTLYTKKLHKRAALIVKIMIQNLLTPVLAAVHLLPLSDSQSVKTQSMFVLIK